MKPNLSQCDAVTIALRAYNFSKYIKRVLEAAEFFDSRKPKGGTIVVRFGCTGTVRSENAKSEQMNPNYRVDLKKSNGSEESLIQFNGDYHGVATSSNPSAGNFTENGLTIAQLKDLMASKSS